MKIFRVSIRKAVFLITRSILGILLGISVCAAAPPLGNRNQIVRPESASAETEIAETDSIKDGLSEKSADLPSVPDTADSTPPDSASESASNAKSDKDTDSSNLPADEKKKAVHPIFVLPDELSEQGRLKMYRFLSENTGNASVGNTQQLTQTVVRLTIPSTVHIETSSIRNPGTAAIRPAVELNNEAGSGFIIERNNKLYVLTNGHVIHASENVNTPNNISIYLSDGRLIHPTAVLSDPATDIAMMEISGRYWPVKLGNSDTLQSGDFVLAIGSPFGLRNSVSSGIISAKGRRNLEVGNTSRQIQDFLQTDAAVHPGNSGGPLVNLRGEVVGMNSAIASNSGFGEGVSFAIPIKLIESVIDQLILSGKVERGWIGAAWDKNYSTSEAVKAGLFAALFTNQPTPVYPARIGAKILSVSPNTPVFQSGLQTGDIILYYDKVIVEDKEHLDYLVRMTRPNKRVNIVFFRNGKLYEHFIIVGQFVPGVTQN